MEYDKIRNKVNKFYKGGKIPKLQLGGDIDWVGLANKQQQSMGITDPKVLEYVARNSQLSSLYAKGQLSESQARDMMNAELEGDAAEEVRNDTMAEQAIVNAQNGVEGVQTAEEAAHTTEMSNEVDAYKGKSGGAGNSLGGLSSKGAGMIAGATVGATKAIDAATMGDKNFGAQSAAIDSAVHGVSGALMSSGNPYAMAAGVALEGANFLTKAGGQTVQGFDVNIENSGFGTLGHMESSSSRDFGAMIGLGGIFNKGVERKLAKRNEQARMALQAAEISEDVKFEQEARMNSVDNVLRNNQIALAGGVDLSLI